jgi:Zn-dependent protease
VLHELAHKFTAMRFGYWAEFRKDNQMLLIAVVLAALAGVVFAAPGATVVYGDRIGRRENGLISAAGPATSLALALGFHRGSTSWLPGDLSPGCSACSA